VGAGRGRAWTNWPKATVPEHKKRRQRKSGEGGPGRWVGVGMARKKPQREKKPFLVAFYPPPAPRLTMANLPQRGGEGNLKERREGSPLKRRPINFQNCDSYVCSRGKRRPALRPRGPGSTDPYPRLQDLFPGESQTAILRRAQDPIWLRDQPAGIPAPLGSGDLTIAGRKQSRAILF